jgi:uncharacterized protein
MEPPSTFQAFLNELSFELRKLPLPNQLAFGASCCERSFPYYSLFAAVANWGEPAALRTTIDRVWSFCLGSALSPNEARSLEARCVSVTPDSDDFRNDHVTAGQEAAFMATLLARRCYDDDPKLIVRIAAFARDTTDMLAQIQDDMDPNSPDLEQKIARHPVVVRELEFQKQDLATLQRIKTQEELQAFHKEAQSRANAAK